MFLHASPTRHARTTLHNAGVRAGGDAPLAPTPGSRSARSPALALARSASHALPLRMFTPRIFQPLKWSYRHNGRAPHGLLLDRPGGSVFPQRRRLPAARRCPSGLSQALDLSTQGATNPVASSPPLYPCAAAPPGSAQPRGT
jgi:hypothetical protein